MQLSPSKGQEADDKSRHRSCPFNLCSVLCTYAVLPSIRQQKTWRHHSFLTSVSTFLLHTFLYNTSTTAVAPTLHTFLPFFFFDRDHTFRRSFLEHFFFSFLIPSFPFVVNPATRGQGKGRSQERGRKGAGAPLSRAFLVFSPCEVASASRNNSIFCDMGIILASWCVCQRLFTEYYGLREHRR